MPYFTLKYLILVVWCCTLRKEFVIFIQHRNDLIKPGVWLGFPLATLIWKTVWTKSIRKLFSLWHLRSTPFSESLLWNLKDLWTLHEVNAAAVTTISDQEEISAPFTLSAHCIFPQDKRLQYLALSGLLASLLRSAQYLHVRGSRKCCTFPSIFI